MRRAGILGPWQAWSYLDTRPYWFRWLYGDTTPEVLRPEADTEEDQQREEDVHADEDDDGSGAIHGRGVPGGGCE